MLVFRLAGRVAGQWVASIATVYLAVHYAWDVPTLWASGSQDLLACLGALAALDLHTRGRRALAAVALGLALLSKESVALVWIVAIALDWSRGETLGRAARKAWPLAAITALWGVVWLLTLPNRPAAQAIVGFRADFITAALIHLLQVAGPGEWRIGGGMPIRPSLWIVLTPLLAIAALLVTERWLPPADGATADSAPTGSSRRRLLLAAAAWAAAGALPVALVAPIWSAYFYLFALCGAALAVGTWLAGAPRAIALGAIGVLAACSGHARGLDEFASHADPWAPQSHVNRHYIVRSMATCARYLSQLERARPAVPHRSVFFFANVPPALGWQAGDGPLVRWAYRDTTLRSYFLTAFSAERATRGPIYFFAAEGESLVDHTDDPMLLASFAYSMMLAERLGAAVDVLELALSRNPQDLALRYWLAFSQLGRGDSTGAARNLEMLGVRPVEGPSPELPQAGTLHTVADTARAVQALRSARDRAGFNAAVHSRLAALCLAIPPLRQEGVVEAFATRVLRPDSPDSWRKWAAAQLAEKQYESALASLERYFALGGEAAARDGEAHQVAASLRSIVKGELQSRALRDGG